MSFPSGNVGFILLHDGTLLSTGDGGSSFSRKTAIPNSAVKGGSTVLLRFLDPPPTA